MAQNPNSNQNPAPGPMISLWWILLILALLISGIALYFALRHMPAGHHGGGCCCCGGGGGGTYSGNGPSPGGSRSGNPGTTIAALPGKAGTGAPDTVDIQMQPGGPVQLTFYLNSQSNFRLGLVTPTGNVSGAHGLAIGSGMQTVTYDGSGESVVHWYLLWNPPMGVVTPPPLASLMTNSPPGSGQSTYSGTYTYYAGSPALAYSATVYINSN